MPAPTVHDVVPRAGVFDAEWSGHGRLLNEGEIKVNARLDLDPPKLRHRHARVLKRAVGVALAFAQLPQAFRVERVETPWMREFDADGGSGQQFQRRQKVRICGGIGAEADAGVKPLSDRRDTARFVSLGS